MVVEKKKVSGSGYRMEMIWGEMGWDGREMWDDVSWRSKFEGSFGS